MLKPLRKCKHCGFEATSDTELDLFSAHNQSKYGRENSCKVCTAKLQKAKNSNTKEYRSEYARNKRVVNPEYFYKYEKKRRFSRYGITEDIYDDMLSEQDNECSICKNEFTKRPHIDHCHTTGVVRGLLCGQCNTALGLFKDSEENLANAIKYLALTATEVALS